MFKSTLILLLYYTINSVFADTNIKYVCNTNVSNIVNNDPIKNLTEYCKDQKKPCAPKCCGLNEVLLRKINNMTGDIQFQFVCTDLSNMTWIDEPSYEDVEIYSKVDEEELSNEMIFSLDYFNLVRNRMFENEECVYYVFQGDEDLRLHILENGMLGMMNMAITKPEWKRMEPDYFCVDLAYAEGRSQSKVIFFLANEPEKNVERERLFVGVASVISSVFLFLVLLVYCLLPTLRNLSGMLLMAYSLSLFFTFMIKAINIFFISYMTCQNIMAVFYFVFLSSFFWLNIMSFDIWWTMRGQRLRRAINRRGEVVKFLWYTLYGWGAPLAITVVAIIIDVMKDKLPPSVIRPGIDLCFNDEDSVKLYLHLPSGLLTLINIVLFVMTIYNIWLIKKKLDVHSANSSNTRKNQNRFGLYLRISMLMGTSWLLELISLLYDESISFGLYVVINLYNGLNGVIIFIMFILNRNTLRMLCKRFNFQFPCRRFQDFIDDTKFYPNVSRSTTKSSNNGSYRTPKYTEDSDVEMYDLEVSTNPNPKGTEKL